MAVILKLLSTKKLNESTKFCTSCTEYKFFLTNPIHVLEWPLVFSEYIASHITDKIPLNSFIQIEIKHANAKGIISPMHVDKFNANVFNDHFEKIFSKVETLSDIITLKVTLITFPRCYFTS